MNKEHIAIYVSPRADKKFRAEFDDGSYIDFGASGYEDFTTHKDDSRKDNYISRHASRENWSYNGRYTAGFWSRWLLWNKPTLLQSAKDINKQFGIVVDF